MTDATQYLPNIFWLKSFFAITMAGLILAWFFIQNRHFEFKSQQPNKADYISLLRVSRLRSWIAIISIILLFSNILLSNASDIIQSKKETALKKQQITTNNQYQRKTPVQKIIEPTTPEPPIKDESELDEIKERYEGIIVTYLFLKECNKLFESDYTNIQQSLQKAVTGHNITTSFYENINSAALGSYEAIYSDSECDPDYVNQTHKQYKAMITEMMK